MVASVKNSIPLLLLLALEACTTVPVAAPARVAPALEVTPPPARTAPTTAQRPAPETEASPLAKLVSGSLDRLATRTEFSWTADKGELNKGLLNQAIETGVRLSRIGGPYYGGSSWRITTDTSRSTSRVEVTLRYRFPAAQIAERVREADRVASQAVAESVRPTMTDYEKELALHDWLVLHAHYDLANYQAGTVPDEEYTPWGVLVAKTGVCDSYSSAFQVLADKAGLETRKVEGTADGGAHSWNQIRLDGRWYNLDVTWDDPTGGPDKLSHAYFNVDDRALATSHVWDRAAAAECSSNDANWFTVQGLVCRDAKALTAEAKAAIQKKQETLARRLEAFDPRRVEAEVATALAQAGQGARSSLAWTYSVDARMGVVEVAFRY